MTRDEKKRRFMSKNSGNAAGEPVRGVLRMAPGELYAKKRLLQTLFCPKKAFSLLNQLIRYVLYFYIILSSR